MDLNKYLKWWHHNLKCFFLNGLSRWLAPSSIHLQARDNTKAAVHHLICSIELDWMSPMRRNQFTHSIHWLTSIIHSSIFPPTSSSFSFDDRQSPSSSVFRTGARPPSTSLQDLQDAQPTRHPQRPSTSSAFLPRTFSLHSTLALLPTYNHFTNKFFAWLFFRW